MLLRWVIAYIGFWLWLRFANPRFTLVTNQLSIFLAIMAVFFNFLDQQLSKRIETPETYIWANFFGKTFKACFTATCFICNNTANDFTIACVILITAFNGYWYFYNGRIIRPSESSQDLEDCSENEEKLVAVNQKIKILVATYHEGYGYRWLAFNTLAFFVAMMFVAMWQNMLVIGILKVTWPTHFMPSTLGYSAVIIILYNAFAWPD